MFFERMYLSYNSNANARKLIFGEIENLSPKAVVHLGDLVSAGSLSTSWEEIDHFVGRLRDRKIDFVPIPGNHEYLFFSKAGISNFVQRFPSASLSGASRRYANVAVILINSNFDELPEQDRTGQLRWFRKTLIDDESDPSIDFIIVGSHRPPFTNSKLVSGSKEIREYYLPDFYKSRKARLFLSGHAHAYEHFKSNGKDFLTIGGSGGLQHPLRLGDEAEYQDVFSHSLEKRMFHFLMVESHGDTLTVAVKMLNSDFKGFETLPQLIFVRER